MATLKDKLSSAMHTPSPSTPNKYRLRVTAGPSYDASTHQVVPVNAQSITFSNSHVTVTLRVRIRSYSGLPSSSPAQPKAYFEHPLHAKDQYGISFAFVPRHDLQSRDAVWGNDFDNPIRDRLPPGFNTAFKIVKEFVDPGLSCDAYADKPWLYGPALSCWFALNVGELDGVVGEDEGKDGVVEEGSVGSGEKVREQSGLPAEPEKRRKFFLTEANREKFVFEKGRKYEADFFNPYLDFNSMLFSKYDGLSDANFF